MYTTDPRKRAEFIAALRALADFLVVTPAMPVPLYSTGISLHTRGEDDDAEFAQVDRLAALLGVQVDDDTVNGGHYTATRSFGPINLKVVAVTNAFRASYEALMSYSDNVRPERSAAAQAGNAQEAA
ncbi:hypothetical protein ACIBF1_15615 [Spirillospora sp. NPDC050679]